MSDRRICCTDVCSRCHGQDLGHPAVWCSQCAGTGREKVEVAWDDLLRAIAEAKKVRA